MSWSPEEIGDYWLLRCADRMEAAASELNEFDGRLGDGDLGATLENCAIQMRTGLDGEFSTPSDMFKAVAMACARASGSSFGTLLSVACDAAGSSRVICSCNLVCSCDRVCTCDSVCTCNAQGGGGGRYWYPN